MLTLERAVVAHPSDSDNRITNVGTEDKAVNDTLAGQIVVGETNVVTDANDTQIGNDFRHCYQPPRFRFACFAKRFARMLLLWALLCFAPAAFFAFRYCLSRYVS